MHNTITASWSLDARGGRRGLPRTPFSYLGRSAPWIVSPARHAVITSLGGRSLCAQQSYIYSQLYQRDRRSKINMFALLALLALSLTATAQDPDCVTRFAGVLAANVSGTLKAFTLSPAGQITYLGDGKAPLVAQFQARRTLVRAKENPPDVRAM